MNVASDTSPAVLVTGLSKTFRTGSGAAVVALDGVDLSLSRGEFVTVVGPSGCGKTTLLRILNGLIPLTSGSVALYGRPVAGPSRRVGMVFQNPVLLPWRTSLQNIFVPIDIQHGDRRASLEAARKLIQLVGIEGFEQRYPSELSGGMQQRVAICRALIHDPDVLMMDEPFGALDALTREQMNLELQRIWLESGKSVLLITHSIPEAVFLADRVLVMSPRPGRIIREVRVDEARPRSLAFMGTPQFGLLSDDVRSHIQASFGVV
jgi:NitT/TauT family transport system ATP-binding protein